MSNNIEVIDYLGANIYLEGLGGDIYDILRYERDITRD
jgi:hypothetical protein